MKYIFFVTTFGSIYDRALSLMEEKKDKGEVIVVASTEQIKLFFQHYTDFKVIRTRVHPDLVTRKTKYFLFVNILRSKLEFQELFRDIENSEIYFCNKSYALVIYSYIKKLSKRNKIFFYGHEQDEMILVYPAEHSLRAFILRGVAKWFMGVEVNIFNNGGYPFWEVTKKYFENITIIKEYTRDKKQILDKYSIKLDILKGKKVLIAIEDSVASGLITKSEFVTKMDQMMDLLNTIIPGAFTIKPHPRLDTLYGKMSACTDVVPSYIPIEFILHHDWQLVIGINSWSVVQATRLTNAKAISLIDAVTFIDENMRIKFRNWIEKESGKKVEFFGNIDDLKKVLEQVK